eukprot:SAG11_NODE_1221_length_5486_cov_7.177650_7_plen_66_part_00
MQADIEENEEALRASGLNLLCDALRDPASRQALFVGCMLQAVQQLTVRYISHARAYERRLGTPSS